MFKKTLLAASLSAISMSAMAVDVSTSTAQKYGAEALSSGLVANAGALTIGTVVLDSNAEYSVGDIITITLTGGKFAAKGAYTLTDTAPGAGKSQIVLGLLNQDAAKLTFRVTSIVDATSGTNSTLGSVLTLAGAAGTGGTANGLTLDSISSGSKVTVSAKAETSTGITIDSAGANDSKVIGEVINQYTLTVDPIMDAVIDVTKARKEFASAAAATFTIKLAKNAVDQASFQSGATDKVTYKVNGSMVGFKDTTALDGKLNDTANDYTVAADFQSASHTYTHDLTGGTLADKALTFTVGTTDAKREVLTAGSYKVDATITVGGKTATVASGKDAGKMALNGASVDIPYVPYGESVEQFIWATNKGSLDGEITVTAFDQNGKSFGPYSLGTAKKKSLTTLGPMIAEKLAADGVVSERVSLNVTVNVPKADLEVFAAYKVKADADRLTLPVNKL